MEDFNLITVDTLNKYFDILSKAGYVKNKEVNKVIILTFLSRLLNDFSEYITEEDYNDIIKSVYCLSDCLIRLPKYNIFKDNLIHNKYNDGLMLRITEDNLNRFMENNMFKRL